MAKVTVFRRPARYVAEYERGILALVVKMASERASARTYRLTITERYVTLTLAVDYTYRATYYAMQEFASDMYWAGLRAGTEQASAWK